MKFYTEKDFALCGLACVLCSQEDCPGCKARGCAEGSDCSVYQCAMGKGLDGCYQCDKLPCDEKMLQGKRNRVFNRYAQEFGKQALIDRLRINYENGITYHKPDNTAGDYDVLETEDEIYQLLRYGGNDPYAKCPVFETEHFQIRQVREEDAEELLACYTDMSTWVFYSTDMFKKIFASRYPTLDEMKACIRFWLDEYKNKVYIRFSVVDKTTGKAIGTIELFDKVGGDKNQMLEVVRRGAVLHIDLAPPYETQRYISELLTLADSQFFVLFGVKYLLTRVIPTAEERLTALRSARYEPFAWKPGREHYWAHSKV